MGARMTIRLKVGTSFFAYMICSYRVLFANRGARLFPDGKSCFSVMHLHLVRRRERQKPSRASRGSLRTTACANSTSLIVALGLPLSLLHERRVESKPGSGRLSLRGSRSMKITDLLSIGSVVHVGSRTAWGLGRYRIEGWV